MSETVLQEAERLINGDRQDTYGKASESFNRIAGLWSGYLGTEVTALDVTNLMILLKVSRTKGKFHRDSYVDIGGYAGLGERLHEESEAKDDFDIEAWGPALEKWGAAVGVRQWDSLDEVPKNVAVFDAGGHYWSFWGPDRVDERYGQTLTTGDGDWLWTHGKSKSGRDNDELKKGPFTEAELVIPVLREPRKWGSLYDVPVTVKVTDADGDNYEYRENGWYWVEGGRTLLREEVQHEWNEFSPFVEVV